MDDTSRSNTTSILGRPIRGPICKSCREMITRRWQTSAAFVDRAAPLDASSSSSSSESFASSSVRLAYQLHAAVVLSRPPQITRDLKPFEKAFFLYQKRLNERLALPFTRYFYYRKDTPSLIDFKKKILARKTAARDIGHYNSFADDGWHDEVLVGAPEAEPEHQMEQLLKDVEVPVVHKFLGEEARQNEVDEIQRPMPRLTEADVTDDQQSLNRLLSRTLYLLVQNNEGNWTFPAAALVGKENFHLAAERILMQSGGANMNTWVVGNAPVGFCQRNHPQPVQNSNGSTEVGQKVFFMRARIMAGQVNLEQNKFGLADFRWLAKEEISKKVSQKYWAQIRNMLPER